MKRLFWAALLLLAAGQTARAQTAQQEIVDRATLTLQDLYSHVQPTDPLWIIRRARGAIICPQVFRASFLFGGSGGVCVMAARDRAGNWSYPAFYGMLSGSFGFQIGLQDVELLMLVMTEHGLNAVMDSQVKLGADASATIATLGTGIEGATSADLSADILVVGKSRGLFAGISLQGSVLTSRTPWDQAYYGQPFAARQITLQGQARNPGAEPLREMLLHYSGAGGAPGYAAQTTSPGYAPAYPPGYAQQGGPLQLTPAAPRAVQQQSLPPPR
jgi:lipid-binding SYLF domain-containing protein